MQRTYRVNRNFRKNWQLLTVVNIGLMYCDVADGECGYYHHYNRKEERDNSA